MFNIPFLLGAREEVTTRSPGAAVQTESVSPPHPGASGAHLHSRRSVTACMGLGLALTTLGAGAARVEAADEFYRGKTLKIIVAAAPGAAYDFVARAVAASIGRYIPGSPKVIVENMTGASGLLLMNALYNQQPRDGTVIGLTLSEIILEPRLKLLARKGGKTNFDLNKMSFIGSPTQQPQILWVWHKTPFQNASDLTKKKARLGATSLSADNYILPTLCNAFLKTKIQIVSGYTAVADIFVSAESGELDGTTCNYSSLAAKADWTRDKRARILIQFGAERMPYLATVPTAVELATNDVERQALRVYAMKYKAAYPFLAPPGVPADRVATIRAAFMASMKDPQFIEQAKKLGFNVDPLSGENITEISAEINKAPEASIQLLKKILG